AGEMVAATHGRSLWVLDVTPLRQMTAAVVKAKMQLYEPNAVVRWHSDPTRNGSMFGSGSRQFLGKNPEPGAHIYYSLNEKAKKVTLKVVDYTGKTVREMNASGEPGLHLLTWDLRMPAGARGGAGPGGGQRGAGPGGFQGRGGFGGGQPAAPG